MNSIKINGIKEKGLQWQRAFYIGVVSSSLFFLPLSAFGAKTAEHYVEEARQMSQAGDLAAAAVSYQKALKLDQNNTAARHELKKVLIESKRQDPEGEYSEAEWALLEESRSAAAQLKMQSTDLSNDPNSSMETE